MSPQRQRFNVRSVVTRSLFALTISLMASAGCQGTGCLFTPSASGFVTPGYDGPVVVVSGLRPCPIGRAYRHPLIFEAFDDSGNLVTRAPFSGLSDGVNPVGVPLYPSPGFHGDLHVRIGECPALLEDPQAALKCDPVRWVREFSVRVPEGATGWRSVRDVSLRRSQCLRGPDASGR